MIWLVLVVVGGAGLAWLLDRELNPRDHPRRGVVTVTIHADIGPFLAALDRIRNTNLDRSTTMSHEPNRPDSPVSLHYCGDPNPHDDHGFCRGLRKEFCEPAPPPSITIPGVPETLTRDQYVALIESVGFRPHDLCSLRFTTEGIYAEVFARNAEGARIVDSSANVDEKGAVATVKHMVFVRVVDAEVEA